MLRQSALQAREGKRFMSLDIDLDEVDSWFATQYVIASKGLNKTI
jgi:hypothetical protein